MTINKFLSTQCMRVHARLQYCMLHVYSINRNMIGATCSTQKKVNISSTLRQMFHSIPIKRYATVLRTAFP